MTDQVIEEIKQKIDIVDLIGRYVNLKPAGSNYKALCPFHQEKTPSFFVSPERGFFKCFGCGESGDIFSFLMKIEGLSFTEALKQLAEAAGVKLTRSSYLGQDKVKEQLYQINKLAAAFYHHLLVNHPQGRKALDYLINQRSISLKTIKTFYLGWSPDQWDGLNRFLTKKGITPSLAEQAGLVIKGRNGVYDRFRGRIIFPLFNLLGEIVGFGGRSLAVDDKTPKYINSPETLIYHKSRHLFGLYQAKKIIRQKKETIITEGEFDVLTAYQAGLKQTIAVKGSALTVDHIRIIKRYAKKIIFSFDNDPAGLKATQTGLILADNQALETYVLSLPQNQDLDDFIKTQQTRPLRLKIITGFKYLLSKWSQGVNLDSIHSRRRFLNKAFGVVSQINDVFLKDNYLELTAEAVNADTALIKESYNQYLNQQSVPRPTASSNPTRSEAHQTRPIPGQTYLLALLIRSGDQRLLKLVPDEVFEHRAEARLFDLIKQHQLQRSLIEAHLPAELESLYNQLFILPGVDNVLAKGSKGAAHEVKRLSNRLLKALIQSRIKKLKISVREKEKQGQPAQEEMSLINKYLKQLRQL